MCHIILISNFRRRIESTENFKCSIYINSITAIIKLLHVHRSPGISDTQASGGISFPTENQKLFNSSIGCADYLCEII